ncbi:nucleotidyltransferase domain-containing protein [Pseudomonas poae]|nr:nucleotidyltransferase domain-containing protein [Pseudomonas poae]
MSTTHSKGVDAEGFILTVAETAVQPEFRSLLKDACASLSLPELGLDGIYLYGSVAQGNASPGVCDLDLTLVLREPPTSQVLAQLEEVRCDLQRRHAHVTKVDFDIGNRAEVLAPENSNSWGFWLKHHCRCLWGDDLSLHFERFRPSRAIALAVNGDFEAVLGDYVARIAHADTEQQRLRLQREASRKLLRATQVLRPEHELTWPQTLEEHVALFVQHYPAKVTQVAFFLFEARNPSAAGDNFCVRLLAFVAWMVSQSR